MLLVASAGSAGAVAPLVPCDADPQVAWLCRFVAHYPPALLGQDPLQPDPVTFTAELALCRAEEVVLGKCPGSEGFAVLTSHLAQNFVIPLLGAGGAKLQSYLQAGAGVLARGADDVPEVAAQGLATAGATQCAASSGARATVRVVVDGASDGTRAAAGVGPGDTLGVIVPGGGVVAVPLPSADVGGLPC